MNCAVGRYNTLLYTVVVSTLVISTSVQAQMPAVAEPTTWGRVRVLDLNSMPWTSPPKRPSGWKFKNIHTIESTGGGAELVFIPPSWSANSPRHYDKENGWYYFLEGQSAVLYYKNPQDQAGTLYINRPGTLFYGVEGAIHFFDQRTVVPEGCVLLSWHDKRPAIQPVPFNSSETTYNGNAWPYPKILKTSELAWEKSADGYLFRRLYDAGEANLEMRYYPPGWKTSGSKQYADYDRWMYMLDGSFMLKVYEGPRDVNGKTMRIWKGQVLEVPANAIFGGADTLEAIDIGAWVLVWRERSGKITEIASMMGQQ
jgi:hypothetical protein